MTVLLYFYLNRPEVSILRQIRHILPIHYLPTSGCFALNKMKRIPAIFHFMSAVNLLRQEEVNQALSNRVTFTKAGSYNY